MSLVSLTQPVTTIVKTCFTCKQIKTSDLPWEPLVPFIFCSFRHCFPALSSKHYTGFSCQNTILFDLLSSLFITEDTVRFENHFLRSCGRTPRCSRLFNCFRILCGRFQAIDIFGEALVTVPMITMFWFQFLRHLVAWIFHSIWWVGRFHKSPFTDILKLLQSILRSFAIRKVYKRSTSWTLEVNHTHLGFLVFFWSSSLCILSLSRRHVFLLLRSALSNHL